jgi:hypothetical protein
MSGILDDSTEWPIAWMQTSSTKLLWSNYNTKFTYSQTIPIERMCLSHGNNAWQRIHTTLKGFHFMSHYCIAHKKLEQDVPIGLFPAFVNGCAITHQRVLTDKPIRNSRATVSSEAHVQAPNSLI